MSRISTHVLDTALGCPAKGVRITVAVLGDPDQWTPLCERFTDDDGRVTDVLGPHALEMRTYRISFDTGAYLAAAQRPVFYPRVEVIFRVDRLTQHHHIPLLLSPFGYSTYRGS
jgi:5-hydroxyisourate hydrolase